ncbi:LOW QUALITY PROTEIN: Pol protein [Phytophthora palmivora]|uniref:Pol protein n=1 Tax=Phytophthora palmivora TaxID=4796 RepID=A0A2P4XFY8_9STRA|nr:LOW QUALITY PROTEIN: Pol protein [Phytophthora palmivora]
MDTALISTERLRIAFALSNLGVRAKTWAYTREVTTPGCFTTWAQLCQQLRATFLPANYEYRQRSRFLACKQGKRELHEYIQEMRVLAASLVGNPLHEHIKVTVFMDGLKGGPSRTQLFRVHANTMEEAIQIALQGVHPPTGSYSYATMRHQAQYKELQQLELAQGRYPWNWVRPHRAPSVATDVGSSGTFNAPALGEGKGSSLPNLGAQGASGRSHHPSATGTGVTSSLGAHETRKSSDGLLVVHASVRGYGDPFSVLIDSGTVVRNDGKYADALLEREGRGQGSVRLADGTVVNVPGVRMDLAVKFEDFDSTETFLVLDMDKYDLILGMPWLVKHEPWIDWRGKAVGASRTAVSDRALVSNVRTSVRDWGARDGRQGAYAPEEVLGVGDSNEGVAMSLATGYETKAHCQACGIAAMASPNAESLLDGTDQAGNIGPQAADAAEESADGVSCVGNIGPQVVNIGPQAGNVVPQAGNIGPRDVEETEKMNESATCISSGGNVVPRGVKKTSTRAEVSLSTSRVDNQVPRSESETPPARPVEEQCHVFDLVSGRQVKAGAVHLEALPEVSALLNLEELSMKDFLAELKAGEIAEMVLLKPDTTPEDLNTSSVLDEDVLEGFTKQRATRLGSEILKSPEYPKYPLVKYFLDVIDLVPGTKYCVTRQWPLPREQCEVIDAFFAEKAKSGMVRESKSPHSTPIFCVRKPNGKWRLVHAYNKLSNASVPAQTSVPRKDMLLNNMSGCTLYSALDLVDGYYQILMRASDISLTVHPERDALGVVSDATRPIECPATFNRLVTQLFRPLHTFAQTYFDDIFVHNRAEGGQAAMEAHRKDLRRVFEVMRANKHYAHIDKCLFAAEEIKVLGCFVSRVGVRDDSGKFKAIADSSTPRSQKDPRKWLGLANYLHKYSAGYAELARPLSDLLTNDADWVWEQQHQDAFDSIKAGLQQGPVLVLPDENMSFGVVCDASDYAIDCVLLLKGDRERERVISFQPGQLMAAERNYPVHDKVLLVMKYALAKFRVHPLSPRSVGSYTDQASL